MADRESSPDLPVVVLASGSPRRRELLARHGVAFDVQPADVDERRLDGEAPDAMVRRLAVDKARHGLDHATASDVVAIGADTVVVVEGDVLGKPRDDAEATSMLERLSGRTHRVLTGVAVGRRTDPAERPHGPTTDGGAVLGAAVRLHVEVDTTEVSFRVLTAADIEAYVATGEPADKAGAYGIQGGGGAFVQVLTGDHDNVVGLPMRVLTRLLGEVGVTPPGPGGS